MLRLSRPLNEPSFRGPPHLLASFAHPIGFGHMHSLPRLRKWYHDLTPAGLPRHPLPDDDVAAGGAYQRRTPHAVVNVLRADQLEVAEGRRSTGELYERNIRVLVGRDGLGLGRLGADLDGERSLRAAAGGGGGNDFELTQDEGASAPPPVADAGLG